MRMETTRTTNDRPTPPIEREPRELEAEPRERQDGQSECPCCSARAAATAAAIAGAAGLLAARLLQCTNHSAGRIRALHFRVLWDEKGSGGGADRARVRVSFQILAEPSTSFIVVRTAAKSIESARVTCLEPVYVPPLPPLPPLEDKDGWAGSTVDVQCFETNTTVDDDNSFRDVSSSSSSSFLRSVSLERGGLPPRPSQSLSNGSVCSEGQSSNGRDEQIRQPTVSPLRERYLRTDKKKYTLAEGSINSFTENFRADYHPALEETLDREHISAARSWKKVENIRNSLPENGLGLRNQSSNQSLLSMASEDFAQPLFEELTQRHGSQKTVIVSLVRTPSSRTAQTTSSAPSPTPILVLKCQDGGENDDERRFQYQSTPCPVKKKQGTPQTQIRKVATGRKEPWKAPSMSDLVPSIRDNRVSPKVSKLPVLKPLVVPGGKRRHSLNSPTKMRKKLPPRIEDQDIQSLPSESLDGSMCDPESPIVRTGAFEGSPQFQNGKFCGFRHKDHGLGREELSEGLARKDCGPVELQGADSDVTRVASSDGTNQSICKSMDITPRPTWSDVDGLLCIDFPQGTSPEMYDVELEAMVVLSEPDAGSWRDLELSSFFCHPHPADFSNLGALDLSLLPLSDAEDADVRYRVENLVASCDKPYEMGMQGIFTRQNLPTVEFRMKEEVHFVSDFSVSVTTDVSVLNPHEEGTRLIAYHIAVVPEVADTDIFAKRAVFDFSFKNLNSYENTVRLYSETEEIVYRGKVPDNCSDNNKDDDDDDICIQVLRDVSTLHDQFNFHLEIPWSFASAQPFSAVRVKPATSGGKVLSETIFITLPPRPLLLKFLPREWDSFKCWKSQMYTNDGQSFLRLDKMPMPTSFPDEMQDGVSLRAFEFETLSFGALQAGFDDASPTPAKTAIKDICHDLVIAVHDAFDEKIQCILQFSVRGGGLQVEELLEICPNEWVVQYAVVDGVLSEPNGDCWRVSDCGNLILYAYNYEETVASQDPPSAGPRVDVKICFEADKILQDVDVQSCGKIRDHKLPAILHKTFLDVEMRCDIPDGKLSVVNHFNKCVCPNCQKDGAGATMRTWLPKLTPGYELSLWFPPKQQRIPCQAKKKFVKSRRYALLQRNPSLVVNGDGTFSPKSRLTKTCSSSDQPRSALRLETEIDSTLLSDDDSSSDSENSLPPEVSSLQDASSKADGAGAEAPPPSSILRRSKSPSPTKLVHWKENLAEVINPEVQTYKLPREYEDGATTPQDRFTLEEMLRVSPAKVAAAKEEIRRRVGRLYRNVELLEEKAKQRVQENAPHLCCITASMWAQMLVALTVVGLLLVFYISLFLVFSYEQNYYEGVVRPGPSTRAELTTEAQGIRSYLAPDKSSLVGAESAADLALASSHLVRTPLESENADTKAASNRLTLVSTTEGLSSIVGSMDVSTEGRSEVQVGSDVSVVDPGVTTPATASVHRAEKSCSTRETRKARGTNVGASEILDWIDSALGWKEPPLQQD